MTVNRTTLLDLPLPVTGTESGTWGDTTNNGLTQYLDIAIAGTLVLSTDADVTLTSTEGDSSATNIGATTAQYAILRWTATGSTTRNITALAQSKTYVVINATGGTQSIVLRGAGPTTGVTIISGEKALCVWNGSDFVKVSSSAAAGGSNTQVQYNSSGVLAGSSNMTFDGTSLTLGGNPTLSAGTANGVLYLNGSKVATSGSALTFDGTNFNAPQSVVSGSIATLYGNTFSAGNSQTWLTNNATASDTYRTTDTAQRFRMLTGIGFTWETAASGTAGAGISWSEQMRLTSTGLGIGTSSPGSKLEVAGQIAAKFANPDVAGIVLQATTGTNAAAMTFTNTGGNGYVGLDNSAGNRVGGGAYTLNIWHEAAYPIAFGTNNTLRMTLNSSGNLGLGVTPSAWISTFKAIQVGNGASFQGQTNSVSIVHVSGNAYVDSGGTYRYIGTGEAAQRYQQYLGAHSWFTAPSGTAGNAITFTQAMTLDASGNLGLAQTNPSVWLVNGIGIGSGTGDWGATIYTGTSSTGYLCFADGTSTTDRYRGYVAYAHATDALIFGTAANERARITSGGDLLVGTTGNTRAGVVAYFASNDIFNSHSGAAAGAITSLYTGWYGATSTTTGTLSFNVTTNGNVTNTNNSYGAISDAKLKENIVDASPKLADLMQVRVRNYNFKEGQTHKQIGVVAQELEQIFPGMVNESPDRDADGNDLGTTTKQVKYSVFVPMLIKAIQEQQALITSLTARVALLEGN